jgi:hypothetical protein
LAVGAARLAGILWDRRRSRPGKGSGSTMCSPRIGWWPRLGRRDCWRGRAVAATVAAAAGCGSGEGGAMPSNGWRHKLLVNLGSSLGRSENTGESWRGDFTGGRQWRTRWSGRSGGGLVHAWGEWTTLNRARAHPWRPDDGEDEAVVRRRHRSARGAADRPAVCSACAHGAGGGWRMAWGEKEAPRGACV